MSDKLFARIIDGVIVETDVREYQIVNRGHPLSLYTETKETLKPFCAVHQRLEQEWVIDGDKVAIKYTVVDMGIQELLNIVNGPLTSPEQETVNIEAVDKRMVDAIVAQTKIYAQDALDKFAQSRLYDNMNSLTSYATSKNDSRRKEAQRGVDLKDAVWDYLIDLESRILSGAVGVPKRADEILSQIPQLTWE